MEKSAPEYLTAEELRNRLYHTLRNRGLVDSVKCQLRNSLVTELQQSLRGQLSLRDLHIPEEGSLLHRAANSLVADHLQHCQYDYSLGVFLPESGLTQDKIFTPHDLMQLMNISKYSKLYEKLTKKLGAKNGKGLLWQFLTEMAALHANSTEEFGVQTDLIRVGPVTSLDDKLHTLEELYSSRREEFSRNGSMAVEERLLSYQRQLEDRYNSELKRELARMKDNEIRAIRMEEKEISRRELDQMRRELDRTYQSKYDSLVERERNSIERLQKEQEIHEKEIYAQRQTLLQEIESIRVREAEIKREAEVNNREKKLQDERVKAKDDELRRREFEVKRKEAETEQRVQNGMAQFKLDYQAKFIERTQNLEVREAKVKEGERQVSEEKSNIQSLKDDLRDKRHRVNELETILQESKHCEVTATKHNEFLNAKLREMSDYKTLKEQSAVLRNELETVRTRLSEVLNMNERERGRQEELLRELRRPSPETLMMQRDLEKARENLRQEQILFEQQKQLLESRLKDEIDRNKELMRRFEEQTLQMKDMNREVVDLRQHLNLTQQALSNEVYRKPQGPEEDRVHIQVTQGFDIGGTAEVPGSPLNISDNRTRRQPRFDDNDIYNDVDLELELPPSGTYKYGQFSEEDISSPGSADVVAEAKYRLKSLEKEAQNLEKAYHDFHCQMTNVTGVPAGAPKASLRKSQGSRIIPPLRSPNQSPIPHERPISSTPYKQRQSGNYSDDSFEELSKKSSGKDKAQVSSDPPPHFNLSNMSEDIQDTRHKDVPRPGEERKEKLRPITMSDLEVRPGSPSIVVMPGSGSSGQPSPAPAEMLQSEQKKESPYEPVQMDFKPLVMQTDAVSLDTAWKAQTVSLEDAWKAQKENEEEEHKKWEEERQQREERKKREQEEAWEREQRELQRLEGKQVEEAQPEATAEEPETKQTEEDIDPVMKQYMAMVQQQKEKEKEVVKKTVNIWSKGHSEQSGTHSDHDISVTEEIKSLNASDDESEW